LSDHLLFKLSRDLASPGALFKQIGGELIIVKIAPYIVSKLSGIGHFPVWIILLNGEYRLAPGFYIALIVAVQQSTNPVLNSDLWPTEWTWYI
jgi:hypothetical protein